MNILRNFDAKKIAKAKHKIFWAGLSIFLLALLFWSPALRVFVSEHPGLIGVLVAVTGEVYFDWKEEAGKHARWKKFFMALLVVSLAYELYEASESDQKAANAIKLAGQANEQAASNEVQVAELTSNNLALQYRVNEAAIELANANVKLVNLKNAIPPRQIPEKQRELFIATLLETNAVSSPKIDIKVFVQDVDDPEAKHFADSVRKMLNEAGYGTNTEEVIRIQPFRVAAGKNERMPQVFAVFATDKNGSEIPLSMPSFGGCIAPFFPTKMTIKAELGNPKITTASYYSTNPNDILGGVRNILNYIGVSTGELKGASLLKPYEVGFYIPPQSE